MKKTRPVKPRRELFLRNNRVEYVNKQNEKKEGTLIFPKTFVTRDNAFWGRTIFLDELSLIFLTRTGEIMYGGERIRRLDVQNVRPNDKTRPWCG